MLTLINQPTFTRLLLATLLGSIVGAERQWRQRAAGMRTTTLVCVGAAAFVDLGSIVGGANTTSVIAYVISGVGFLGAGAIMKEGGSIRGLNTAATLWCSAAVGASAGCGQIVGAIFVSLLLLTINVALRPLSRAIDRRSAASVRSASIYRLSVICLRVREQSVSGALMRSLAARPLTLRQLRSEETEDSDDVQIQAVIESSHPDKPVIESLAGELKLQSGVVDVEWAETNQEVD